jgi:hypothetical protein
MSESLEVTCSWEQCPTHETYRPEIALSVHWPHAVKKIRYFHSTECLAGFALSFPAGMLITGEDSINVS